MGMNVNHTHFIRASCFLSLFVVVNCFAVDHTRSPGEPYALAGKRLVFTNWYYVRPGQLDWKNDAGESVYGNQSPLGPFDSRFEAYDAPEGIRLVAEPAEHVGPIITRAKPWEKMGINAGTLIYDEGKFRLWGGSQQSSKQSFKCYFESTDGKTWTRPELGLVDFEGNKKNNLLPDSPHIGSVFIDPNAAPAERFKSVWAERTDPKIIEEYRKHRPMSVYATDEDPGKFHSIRAGVSPDGFHWTDIVDPISVEISDTQIIAYYDQQLKKYVMFTRGQLLGPRAEGMPQATARRHAFIGRRAIGRSETDNFREFPLSEVIIQPGADMPPTDTYYTNCKTTIPGAPDQHLLFPTVYHQADDTTSVDIFSSNDTKNWSKIPGSPILGISNFGAFDGGCIFACPNLVELPDGDWALPYNGYVYPHKYPRGAWGFDFGLAVWPKGRLIALEAPEQGKFATVAFVAPGKRIRINAVTKRAGNILVEVADLEGKPIAGHSFDDAKPIVGDQFRQVLSWKGGDDIGVDSGTPILLRFRMDKAKIYGLDFE